MKQFIQSPHRAWRWLFSFLGILISVTSAFVLLDWPNQPEPKDEVMLLFPLLILASGCWLFITGTWSTDEKLVRIVKLMQKLGGHS